VLFDQCAECQRCCRVDPGFPSLEISLTHQESKRLGSVCIDETCQHLGNKGCTMGEDKPFSCRLYPLSYNPKSKNFWYDVECPLMPQYIAQLKDAASEASAHLSFVMQEIQQLSKIDPDFLATNYEIDVDYFELKKLPGLAPSVPRVKK
jgi:Fe-S-cluster containining protein